MIWCIVTWVVLSYALCIAGAVRRGRFSSEDMEYMGFLVLTAPAWFILMVVCHLVGRFFYYWLSRK